MNRDTRSLILSLLGRPATLGFTLVVLNVWICRELFVVEYLDHLDSIAGAYVGLTRWIVEHPMEWDWFPLWYGGIPFQNVYPPVLHFLSAGFAGLTGASPAHAHHAVTAAMYCLGPVTLFWFAWRISGEKIPSFFVGLFYSVVAPSALLIPEIASDTGTAFGSRRLHALVRYGEGPHIAAMTLLPVALLALHWALGKRKPVAVYAAAISLCAVVLTNWLGAFALAAAVAGLLLALDEGLRRRTLLAAAGVGALAYTLASPWVPPSTIADIRRNAEHIEGDFPIGPAQVICLLLLLGAAGGAAVVLRRLGAGVIERFAAFFLIVMAGMTLSWYWLGLYMLPQPHRYHLEMDIAIALAVPFAVAPLARRLRAPARSLLVALCLVMAIAPLPAHRRHARWQIQPVEIEGTIQYQTARWLDEKLPGARVFVSGSSRYWLSAFADNPQLGGGFDQGITNPTIPHVIYGAGFVSGDGENTLAWMRTFGVDAVVVGGPESRDVIKDFKDPAKFDGLLNELYRDGDDVIYDVPRRSRSLAHVIPQGAVITNAPANYLDSAALSGFVAAIEDENLPLARLVWEDSAKVRIESDVPSGHVVAVQASYDPGWRASVNGQSVRVFGDEVGLMIVEPGCSGPCRIELSYGGGVEMLLARLASGGALLAGGIWVFLRRRRK